MTISDKPVPSGGLLKMHKFSIFSAHFWRFFHREFRGFSIFSKNVRFSQKMKMSWVWKKPCKAPEISVWAFFHILVVTRIGWSYFCKNGHFRQAGTFWGWLEDTKKFQFFQRIFENQALRWFLSCRFGGSPEISVTQIGQNKPVRNFWQKNRAPDFSRDFRPFSNFCKKMEFSPMHYVTRFSQISDISCLIRRFGE